MLKELFRFFDTTHAAYWTLALIPTIVLAGWIVLSLWRHAREAAGAEVPIRRRNEILFAMLALGTLLAWRWPLTLAAHEYSSDESQQIAAALTLTRDPVFWRSVDADTAGPGDIFALLPAHMLGVPLDFFCARLTGLLLVWGMLMGTYFAFRQMWSAPVARLSVLPGILLMSVVTENDLTYYTTEHFPLFLIGLSFFLLWRSRPKIAGDPPAAAPLMGAAALAGLLPWSKLQSVPLGFALAGTALAAAVLQGATTAKRRLRIVSGVILAGFAPSIVQFAILGAAGEIDTFWKSYIQQNASYVANGNSIVPVAAELFSQLQSHSNLYAFLKATGIVIGVAAVLCAYRRRTPGTFFWSGVGLTAVSVVVVLAPQRAFPHYLLFLVPALVVLGGAAAAEAWLCLQSAAARRSVAALLVGTGFIMPLTVRLQQPAPAMVGNLLHHWHHPRSEISLCILRYAKPGDALAIWGWSPTLYVETGMPQAVHDGHVNKQIERGPYQSYFLARYLKDLERNLPPLFVDVVGPGCFPLEDRANHGHEAYADIHAFVRENYTFVSEIRYARIYVRNDRHRELQRPASGDKT